MANKLWRNIWTVLNTEIQIPWSEAIDSTTDATGMVLDLAKALEENKTARELAPFIANLDSLLDVLNSPLAQVAGSTLPFVSLATGILQFIVDRTRQEPSLEEAVLLVSQAAYLESTRQFLRKYLPQHPKIEKIVTLLQDKKASAGLIDRIQNIGEQLDLGTIPFDDRDARETLICFHDSPLAKAFDPILVDRLQESGWSATEARTVSERISRGTHRYLKEAVAQVRDKVPTLAAIYGEGWLRDLEAYGSIDKYLQEIIAIQPDETVFDEAFAFRDIYVPLEVKPVRDGKVVRETRTENIEIWAANLLQEADRHKQVLFVQGGPGRGKSVFCRMFADWVRRELHPIYTPILIRLRDVTAFEVDLDKTLSAAVGWDFASNDSGWLTDRNTRFLFLLDGFDELLLERGGQDGVEQLLDQVEKFQKRAAENSERGHRVIITGRPLALAGLERTMPPNLARVAIELMSPQIQQTWFQKWEKLAGTEKTVKFRQFLEDNRCPEQVRELAREPLLLYLLAAMHRDDSFSAETFDTEDGDELKVRVYQAALEWVLTKQRSEDGRNLNPKIVGLDEEDLRSLLAEAGLCVVQSGNERSSIQPIEDRLVAQGNAGAKELIEVARQNAQKNPLKNALAAFYLKATADRENSVEFFHKSFGEFLCAERMAQTLTDWTQKTGRRRKTYTIDEATFNKQVYDLLGYGNLSGEIVGYLRVLLRQNEALEGQAGSIAALFERLQEFYRGWCEGAFLELFDASAENLPWGKARQLQKYGIERGQCQVDIYAGLNVLILLLELHRYGQSREDLKDEIVFYPCGEKDSDEFDRDRLLRVVGYSQCLGIWEFGKIAGKFFTCANLGGANLGGANLSGANLDSANLSSANLSGANLSSANLKGVNLGGADLRGADLRGTDLRGADLSGAYLRGTDLSGADLGGTYLSGADLCNADLTGADLRGAYLNNANLNGANLNGANLTGANLSSANLMRADLSGADLSGTDLVRAYLMRAKLTGVNLTGANLTGANLGSAHLIRANLTGTKLVGANLSSADLMHANLDGTDLREAYLIRTDLDGANLSGTHLSGADLIRADLSGANLGGAYLSRADLTEVKWDSGTQWGNAIGLHEARNISDQLVGQHNFTAATALSRGYRLAMQGQIDGALAAYREAQHLDADLKVSPRFWNCLCWFGCLHHRAADVLFAGESAVRLSPENGECRDTRGLARALTGDIAGAIEDFQAALDLRAFEDSEAERLQRQGWLDALQRGENPFTLEELERLREG
ncbi:MAG: pentapeptide repeat-containing protein [Cyanobacteriota bacterium]|nr:pentapeptide repeat-containing protein [Cyanobacteriota bacterium]